MYIIRNIRSEWLKMKRLFIKPCLLVLPILYSLFMLIYEQSLNYNIHEIYKFFLSGMCVGFPIVFSIYLSVMNIAEEKASNFQNILSNKTSKIQYLLSKIILLILLILFVLLIALITLEIGNIFIYNIYLPIILFIKGIILFSVSSIPMIVLYLALTYMFGTNVAILLGCIGLLISTVMGTTVLGDNMWCFFPSSYSLRICANLVIRSYEAHQIYISLIIALTILIISCAWFLKWEGRRNI